MYRKALLRLSGNKNKPNRAERFVAGALAGQHSISIARTPLPLLGPHCQTCVLLVCGPSSWTSILCNVRNCILQQADQISAELGLRMTW